MQIRSKSTRETGSTFPLTYCRPDINSSSAQPVPRDFIYEELHSFPTDSPAAISRNLPGFSRDLFADKPMSTRLVSTGYLDRVPPRSSQLRPLSPVAARFTYPRLYLSQVITSPKRRPSLLSTDTLHDPNRAAARARAKPSRASL